MQTDSADRRPILKLRRVIVMGAETLPASLFEDIWSSFRGQMVSQADLLEIAAKMTSLYREKGYFLSRAIIPPQDIASGTVRVQVIEGQISSITIKGDETNRFGAHRLLRELVRPGPAVLSVVERKLLLVNDLPGVKIQDTAFTEEGEASGRFTLVVALETWRLHSAQGVDNTGSQAVGPWQSYATAAVNSALVAGDSTSLSLSTVPNLPKQLFFGRFSYDAPLGGDGVRVGGSALYSDVAPGDFRQLVKNHTQTQSFELRGSFVPYQTRKSAVTVVASLGLTDVSEKDMAGTRYDDHLRTISLLGSYRFQDDLGGFNAFSLVYRQGLSLLGATVKGSPLASRPGASGEFTTVGVTMVRVQKLTEAWSLKAGGGGQYSPTPLLLSQQYYLGSAGLGPGYVSGDSGLSACWNCAMTRR